MPGRSWDISDYIKGMRELGLENAVDRWYSIYPATVVDDADETQQGKSRVKVNLMGFPEEHPRFSYPVSPYAGRNFGFFFPPHKDSPAWVTFDMGDTNSARVVGSWWMNEESDKKPSSSHVPAEFVKKDGSAPTARGIKTQGGSLLIFEDDLDNYYTELSSGRNITEVVEVKDTQGNTVNTIEQIKIGEPAKKHHRVRLDDQNEQIIIATFGDQNNNSTPVNDNDDSAQRDQKELDSRLRHIVTMSDRSDDRFVKIKTIGNNEDDFHSVELSDTDKKIKINSTNHHFIELDDQNERIVLSTEDGFKAEFNKADSRIVIETPGNRVARLDDQTEVITINDNNHEFTFDNSGTLISDETGQKIELNGQGNLSLNFQAGDTQLNTINLNETVQGSRDVTITGNDTASITGNMTVTVTGALQKIASSLSLLISGTVTITGATVTVSSATVNLGTGTLQRLVNETMIPLFNSHFHISGNPGAPTLSATASGFTAVTGVQTTIATSAA